MSNLVIVGAGGWGREVYWMALGFGGMGRDLSVKGFLDDRAGILAGHRCDHPVLGAVEDYLPEENDVFVCAMASPKHKRAYAALIEARGGRFVNLVHPSCCAHPDALRGNGVMVFPFCTISGDVRVGDHVGLNSHVSVGHDAVLGDFCHINSFAFVGGGARIGEDATLHTHATVLPGVTVGRGATVGAGSVAVRDVPPGETVFGVPAVRVRW